MKVIFLGVGEAFDENVPNNSHLIHSKTKLLLDCGPTIPSQVWKYNPDKDFLDGIYISHLHGDHYFGIPALFLRMWEDKRTKPLTLICQKGAKEKISQLVELAYPGMLNKFEYPLKFIESDSGKKIKFNELTLEFSPVEHSIETLAVKVSDGKNIVCYGGDGMFKDETEKLYENADLLIQETYLYDQRKIGHGCITDAIEMAKRRKIKTLALTHINREFRKEGLEKISKSLSNKNVKVIIPEPMQEYKFS
ncbi:MAG: MBL fold metallo-hydrolase [Nanobdellota archaeon]